MNASGDDFLTVADIARILKLNQQTVRNWIDQGSLPALRVGRRVRVRRSDFEALLEGGRTVARAASGRSPAQAFWEGDFPPNANGRSRRRRVAPGARGRKLGRYL